MYFFLQIFGIMKQAPEELIGSTEGGGVEGVVKAAGKMINHWSGSVGTVEVSG